MAQSISLKNIDIGKEYIVKNLIMIAGFILILVLAYFGIKKLIKSISGEGTIGAGEGLDQIQPGSMLTIDNNQAITIASQLEDAMKNMGTDEETIFSLMQPLTKDDIMLVYQKFGKPYYDTSPFGYGGATIGFLARVFATPLDLFGWFKEELDNKETEQMRALLAEKGITF